MITVKPPMVLAYLRYSSDGQRTGDSIARQETSAAGYAKAQGWTLGKENVYADQGVSAYRKKNLLKGKFAEIIRKLKDGRIPPGSVMIVEAFDRISRADVSEALVVILDAINNGLRIVTLKPEPPREFIKGRIDTTALILAIIELARATGESEAKSFRSARNWEKRRAAALAGAVMSASCPAWIEVRGGKYALDPSAARTVREIFRLCLLGYGTIAIPKLLSKKGFLPIGRSSRWSSTYIRSIIGNRATYGVWQPHRIVDGKKTPLPVVEDYYPPVIDRETYDAANRQITERRKRPTGGACTRYVNVYNPILVDRHGNPYTSFSSRGYRQLVSTGSLRGAEWQSLREEVFDFMFFNVLAKKRWSKHFLPPAVETNPVAVTTIDSKRKQVRNLTTKIEAIQARVLADQSADTAFVELLAGLVNQRKRLQDEIDSTRESRIVNDKQRVIRWLDLMATGGRDKMSTDDRMEVRAILRRLISRVTLTIETEGHKKIIEGRFTIHPANASAPLLCRFTYRPFQGKRKREVSELVEYHVSD